MSQLKELWVDGEKRLRQCRLVYSADFLYGIRTGEAPLWEPTDLRDNEELIWVIGEELPRIITVQKR